MLLFRKLKSYVSLQLFVLSSYGKYIEQTTVLLHGGTSQHLQLLWTYLAISNAYWCHERSW